MLLRRHHITSFLQALLVCFAFTSCARDYFSDDFVSKDESNSTFYYLTIQLQLNDNSLSTRATETNGDDLEYGEHDEHMIGKDNNIIILFKKDKEGVEKLFGVFDLTSLTGHEHNTEDGRPNEEDPGTNKDNNVNENIEAIHRYSTKFPADGEAFLPTSCLVVLNCSEAIHEKLKAFNIGNTPVDEILRVIWDKDDAKDNPRDIGFADTEHKYFTMTNSIYFDNNEKQAEVAIPKDFIAKSLMAAKPVTIRVERMVSKFSFELPNKENPNIFQLSQKRDMIIFGGSFNDDGSPKLLARNWRIVLTGWNMNALETQSNLFKNIDNTDYFEGYSDQGDWNHPANYRSHWSQDPHYFIEDYPWQYRKAIDYKLVSYENKVKDEKDENYLRNYSFNALGLGGSESGPESGPENSFQKTPIYIPENTYDASSVNGQLDSRDDLLAGTHLLVGAEFQIKLEETDLEQGKEYIDKYFVKHKEEKEDVIWATPKHLFRDRNGFYYLSERECVASLVHDFNQLLNSQGFMVFTHYWFWNIENAENEVMIAKTEGEYSLYYKDNNGKWDKLTAKKILEEGQEFDDEELMPIATLRGGDGKRLPWIDKLLEADRLAIGKEVPSDGGAPSLVIYYPKENDYGTLIPDEEKEFKETKSEKNFIKSMLYEWLGSIDHFNEGKMYYSHGVVDNPPIIDGKKLRYGAVRNNWYQFQLRDVTSFGTPVDDLDQPIVPERNGLKDQINFTIRILGWHDVETSIPLVDLNGNKKSQ